MQSFYELDQNRSFQCLKSISNLQANLCQQPYNHVSFHYPKYKATTQRFPECEQASSTEGARFIRGPKSQQRVKWLYSIPPSSHKKRRDSQPTVSYCIIVMQLLRVQERKWLWKEVQSCSKFRGKVGVKQWRTAFRAAALTGTEGSGLSKTLLTSLLQNFIFVRQKFRLLKRNPEWGQFEQCVRVETILSQTMERVLFDTPVEEITNWKLWISDKPPDAVRFELLQLNRRSSEVSSVLVPSSWSRQRKRSNKRFTTWTSRVWRDSLAYLLIKALISLDTDEVRSVCGGSLCPQMKCRF